MTEFSRNIGIPRQCFPVRSLTRSNAMAGNAGGAWLVAYREEQRRRFKAVLCQEPDVALNGKSSALKQSLKTKKLTHHNKSGTNKRKFDAIYLMKTCVINDPLDLCSINISGKGFSLVNEGDFAMFENVVHIDAGDNNLQLVHFRLFPSLKTLELPLNNISGTILLEEKDFVWLESLDLSFNRLTTHDVLALGVLPALKDLHLTGNQLSELPSEMGKSFISNKGQRLSRFVSLEKLWLDQNNLKDVNTFTCLAGLGRLKYLNLERNDITFVPHLKILGRKIRRNDFNNVATSNFNEAVDEKIVDVSSKISFLEEMLHNSEADPLSKRHDVTMEEENDKLSQDHLQNRHISPFSRLRHLNLANNQIEVEQGLLTLSSWPHLEEVVIWGNPVATRGKEGPPVIIYQLGFLAGIEVKRHEPLKRTKDTNSLALTAPPRKVAEVPTVSQTRNLLILETSKQPELAYSIKPLPPISSSTESDIKRVMSTPAKIRDNDINKDESLDVEHATKTEEKSSQVEIPGYFTPRQNVVSPEERVFLTQAEDAENDEVLFFDNDEPTLKQSEAEEREPKPAVPQKYQGYEDLLNIDERYPEDIELPKGIHGNVRALQFALDHPLIFTEKSAGYHKKGPSKRSLGQGLSSSENTCPTTIQELGSILDKMRTHTKTVEYNLGDVLCKGKRLKSKSEIKEAKKLLNEVQTKYDKVRCESLRSTTMAADILQKTANTVNMGKQAKTRGYNGIMTGYLEKL